MRNMEFFEQIAHVDIPWGDRTICCPVFYYDVTTLSAQFLASIERVREALPSPRMYPLRVTPWHCVVSISAFEYRDTDLGPYNEVLIGIPFVLDEPSPLFTGVLRRAPAVPQLYIRHLPVTTEMARDAGVEFAGFPKFIAEIEFERGDERVACHVREDGRHILSLSIRKGVPRSTPRWRMHPIAVREGRILRCEFIVSERRSVEGRDVAGARVELGDHPITRELREWKLGRMLAYQHAPRHQAILSPILESLAVDRPASGEAPVLPDTSEHRPPRERARSTAGAPSSRSR